MDLELEVSDVDKGPGTFHHQEERGDQREEEGRLGPNHIHCGPKRASSQRWDCRIESITSKAL